MTPPKLPSITSPWLAYSPFAIAIPLFTFVSRQAFAAHNIFGEIIAVWALILSSCSLAILYRGRARFNGQLKEAIARHNAVEALQRGDR